MKSSKMMVALSAMALSVTAMGAGFGLYEASARGVGMGNGLVGSTGDATANYHNPANLTEVTDPTITVGMSLINPFCDVKVDGQYQRKMNAGWFPPPHVYAALPLGEDFVFGFGTYCEFGLGTKYDNNWALNYDTTETTIQQFTFNPNIAYKISDDWSVSLGARISYMTFENYKNPLVGTKMVGYIPVGIYGRSHLKGDDLNCGFVLGTSYKVTDKLSLGAVYRSRINHRIEGDSTLVTPMGVIAGDAKAKVVLPSSVVFGANYDFTEAFRGGVSVTWTEWSTINHIDFNLPTGITKQNLNWHDTWRVGFGFEYDFTSDFTGRIGYSYDCDPSGEAHGTTMLPPGDRHIVGFGVGYKFCEDWRIDLGYNIILMESESRMIEATALEAAMGRNAHKMQCDNSYSHIVSASVSYTF